MDTTGAEDIAKFQSTRNYPTSSFWDFFKIPSFLRPTHKSEVMISIPDIEINSGEGPMPEAGSSSRENDNVSVGSAETGRDDDTSSIDTNHSTNSLSEEHLVVIETAGGSDPETNTSSLKRRGFTHIISPEDVRLLSAAELTDEMTARSILRSRVTRPRLASHPNFSSPSYLFPGVQTAPVVDGARRKSIFFHLRRASHVGLAGSDSMVSLTNRALVSFIAEENYPGIQHFLENRKICVDDRDENGASALMVASTRNKLNFVRLLIENGADVNAEDNDKWSPLLFAAKEGHEEIIVELLEHGANIDPRDLGGWTPLMWSCYKNRAKAAHTLMEKGADVNAFGDYNVTSLGWAAGRGSVEIVRDLVRHGARVNTGDKYGTTPLIWASRKGYAEIVDALLSAEANVDACGMTSWTALLVAAAGNHVDVVKLLLEHKPNVNALDKDGCSALTIACKEGFHDIAVALTNYGAYINTSDRSGTTNLIHAAKGGHLSIAEALLKKHVDVNMYGKDRKTALYWAIEKSHVRVVRHLLGANPDLEIATKEGDTCLLKAVRNRNAEIVALLLEKRAKVSAADKNGDTCLHIAMRARSKQIVELLLRNPVHSQLLYRPNRAGETPYNIDRSSPKPILPQIFGHRGLNTQEDGENLLGYSLYSSALADMLSDPSLNMPIVIGLFARWGSGKSFLLGKLRDEMKSFAKQWYNPVFSFSVLIFIVVLSFSTVIGIVVGLSVTDYRWIIGISFTFGIVVIIYSFLFFVWFSTRRAKYDWSLANRVSRYLAAKADTMKLICQVIFCHPPGAQYADEIQQAQPINFYFTDQTKISSTTAGENSIVHMLGSLYTCLENDYGSLATRLYRAFTPHPVSATSDWKWRRLCCIPYFLIVLACFVCTLLGLSVLVLYLLSDTQENITLTLQITMYSCVIFVGLLIVANFYTLGQVSTSVIFSHRRHLQRAVSKLYALKAEGILPAIKTEVNLITDMVKCLNAFTKKQSRMVVVVDGLDSDQEKVLQVLDAVHILFSDNKAPFIILLAIDPHIIAKGIEMNINPVLNESNISAHDYLRNLIHLPFYLQNAALRKVKHVKMLESTIKKKAFEDDPGPQIVLSTRRASVESAFGVTLPNLERFEKPSKGKPKRLMLKASESIASSLASNLNKVNGPTDLKKMLLGDDYFSDVNPRSMRRLMNIIHITGRLMKAFNIDFNWYHLSTFVNVSEQWPYRLSWMILYCEQFQRELDDSMSLKVICERVKPFVPITKEVDPNLALDRDDKKLDVYLGLHKGSLLVSTMYIFLPFTINLDPQLRKDITEQYQPLDQLFKQGANLINQGVIHAPSSPYIQPNFSNNIRFRNSIRAAVPHVVSAAPTQTWQHQGNGSVTGQMPMALWPYAMNSVSVPGMYTESQTDPMLVNELKNKRLSILTVDGVCDLMFSLPILKNSNFGQYQDIFRKHNICGRVLLHCDLSELKQVLAMTFGDWELFKSVLITMRELDRATDVCNNNLPSQSSAGDVRINISKSDKLDPAIIISEDKKHLRPNVLEKQVTMEEQMICGALELLNDDAREDARKGDDSSSTLSPINSETGIEFLLEPQGRIRKNSKSRMDQDETDVLYVTGTPMNIVAELPDSPSILRKLEITQFSITNEKASRSPPRSRTESVIIQSKNSKVAHSPLLSKSYESPGKKHRALSRNPSVSSTCSHFRRDGSVKEKGILKSPATFDSRRASRKASKPVPRDSSSDTSSDESQKALISKVSAASSTHSARKSSFKSKGTEQPQSPKKRLTKEDTTSRFSKLKTSFFGVPKDDHQIISNIGRRATRNETADESSEPAVYFREPAHASRHQGQPWAQYRAPTPMPVFGSEEYYKYIKSSNPSPTTSNESELGSTPSPLSSGENLFLPGPPDLPESPFPRRNVGTANVPPAPIPSLSSFYSFVPFQTVSGVENGGISNGENASHIEMKGIHCLEPSTSRASPSIEKPLIQRPPIPRKTHARKIASSGEENPSQHKSHIHSGFGSIKWKEERLRELRFALGGSRQLVKTPLMQSDPVLFNSNIVDKSDENANTKMQDGLTLQQIHDEMNAQFEEERRKVKEELHDKPNDDSSPRSPLMRQVSVDMESTEPQENLPKE